MLRRTLAPGPAVPRLRFRAPSIHLPLWLLGLGWLAGRLLVALVWLVLHPRSAAALLTLAGCWLLWLEQGWRPFLWAAALLAVPLGLWWARWPDTFQRHVQARAHAAWRWLWVYRRDWQPAMVTSGLSLAPGLGGALPTLKGVRVADGWDLVRVRMLPGQTLEQWQTAAPRLAQTWGLRVVRVRRTGDPQMLTLLGRRQVKGSLAPAPATLEQPATEPARPRGAFPRHPGAGA